MATVVSTDEKPRRRRKRGSDRWLSEARSCVLLIPSVIVPTERNVAINPAHPQFTRITVSRPRLLKWDQRLQQYLKGRRG